MPIEIFVYTTKEAAKHLRVGEEQVRSLIRAKKLRAYSEGRRGGYRILPMDLIAYVAGRTFSGGD